MLKEFKKNKVLLSMLIPGLIILLINNYLPMFGILLAFKDFKFTSDNFFTSLLASDWVGFKNFEFFTKSIYIFTITRNTLLYNGAFIILTLVTAVPAAILMNELRNRTLAKFYQSAMLLPQFLSWVVVGILAFSFLSMDMGFINKNVLAPLGFDPILWYNEPRYWPYILPLVHIWKTLGYYSIIFLAGITGIDSEIYEAAVIDGASKTKQIFYITIPLLFPLMTILTLLQIGRVFYADFGLFYQTTQNSGILYSATNVIDVYVYNALRVTGDASMAAAVGLYQATAGFILVITSNWIVKRINKDSALF
ncbi:ABC transporter permease subunit [Paenibacillus sp. LMG 31461]|uniref:ABC transporter permease subunit n=1 Tax=Paenibacillus plantarum TaxID=2654975 RepID=A0ABX1XCG2_9BACL|nr:ABC transporter permease subunit [Paenibacillus plantarum]NOU65856.1 ABC transporter permease subunit [Paenibacillus plantarum]